MALICPDPPYIRHSGARRYLGLEEQMKATLLVLVHDLLQLGKCGVFEHPIGELGAVLQPGEGGIRSCSPRRKHVRSRLGASAALICLPRGVAATIDSSRGVPGECLGGGPVV